MIIKNVHLFYFSPTYTTKKTVKAIAEGLSTGFIEHDLTFSFESEEEFFLPVQVSLQADFRVNIRASRFRDLLLQRLSSVQGKFRLNVRMKTMLF